ncbi:MAG: HAMP domain-containing sensor histidine kinase [Actinomycetota bacterium]
MRWHRSLRVRLAALIFVAIAVPVIGVATVATQVTRNADVTVISDGAVDVENVETRIDPVAEGWVWATVVVVLVVAAAAAWIIAGRTVSPVERIRATADGIEAADLGRRIGMERGADELVALAASFDRMLDRLEEAAHVQRDFVAETSHELRTPLAVLQTNIDLLLQDPDADLAAHREAADTTRRSVARLRTLVDDLLLTARAGARGIDHDPAPAYDLLAAVVAARTAEEQARLGLPDDEGAPVVEVDAASVERALRNLVDNALERTDGAISLGVGRLGGWCGLGVRDRGSGVDAALAIFEPYVSGSGGTGLGLAIADQVARAHGGAVTVRSAPAEGATFVLWVPIESSAPTPPGVDPGAHRHEGSVEGDLVWGRV